MRFPWRSAAVSIAATVLCSWASPVVAAPAPMNEVAPALLQFLTSDSVAEIDLSRFAVAHSQDPNVRAFAQRMISDHTRMIGRMQGIATQSGMSLAMKPSDEGKIEFAHLTRYHGRKFDVEYMKENIKDHLLDIDLVRHAGEVLNGPMLAFVRQTLPQLESHLTYAESVTDAIADSH